MNPWLRASKLPPCSARLTAAAVPNDSNCVKSSRSERSKWPCFNVSPEIVALPPPDAPGPWLAGAGGARISNKRAESAKDRPGWAAWYITSHSSARSTLYLLHMLLVQNLLRRQQLDDLSRLLLEARAFSERAIREAERDHVAALALVAHHRGFERVHVLP